MTGFIDTTLMPWGRYKGEMLANVPDKYLLWLYENNKAHGLLKAYIHDNLAAIRTNANGGNARRN